jgi:hypothetical protein
MNNTITGTKLLSHREQNQLKKFNNLSYSDKQQLKYSNPEKYLKCIQLIEQQHENQKIISHHQYRKSASIYNKKIVESINPAFFITIKYIDSIATSHERVVKLFEGIKYHITKDKPCKLIHYIEKGQDNSYHSHIFVSSLKHKQKPKQLKWLHDKFNEFIAVNKFSIATGSMDNPSVLLELFDEEILNKPKSSRNHYVSKQNTRQYLSIDITNSDIKQHEEK